MPLDRIDARIIAELQADGRLSVVELGERIGLTGTPCARRVRQLEQRGVIAGYTAIVDRVKLGLNVQAFIQVKLDHHTDETVESFERALAAIEQVVSCHATTGEYDFMLQVIAPDLEALSALVLKQLLKITGVRDVHSSIVLDTVKHSARLPVGHLANYRSDSGSP
ncbi:MAG: Lrp/AsnC family transcriptional regulator [Steroidobacteraceae bacterium]